jgi:hypothetical protein
MIENLEGKEGNSVKHPGANVIKQYRGKLPR